jgi:hypothetical protein
MNTIERAIDIVNSCKNEQQTEVATRFIELLIKLKPNTLSKEEKTKLLTAIDNKLNDLKHDILTKQQTAFV